MDRITESLLNQFCQDHGFAGLKQDDQFEIFSTYLVLSRFQSETPDLEELMVGGGGDTGLDSISAIVNGAVVFDPEEIEELAGRNKYLDVTFVFVQAERSPGFTTSKINQIGVGIDDFFSQTPALQRSEKLNNAAAVMAAIYKRAGLFTKGNPACQVFYVTTGKWTGDQNLEARRQGVIGDLTALNLFREVDFVPVDAADIQKLYQQMQNAVEREFTFATKTVIPEIPGVTQAYLGLLPAPEFLTLIQDERGNILKSIFYDNVRDWQDYNEVNNGIRDTLAAAGLRSRFALMNNGITIIAKTLQLTGNKVRIGDYQIVNGCQTSHVLHDERASLDGTVMVPLRVIATLDDDVTASIIKATNRQTEVKEEQLLALSDFQKTLEVFFAAFEGNKKLYYERRSRQYAGASIEKTRVVTMTYLIRAFVAMFRDLPHRTTRGYGEILDEVGASIFAKGHAPEPYYVAAFAHYRLEYLYRNVAKYSGYKVARYHILWIFRLLASTDPLPRLNSHEMKRYAELLMEKLWDTAESERLFSLALEAIEVASGGNLNRDRVRTNEFTDAVRKHCGVMPAASNGSAAPVQAVIVADDLDDWAGTLFAKSEERKAGESNPSGEAGPSAGL